jgi:hypothetical protein
LSQHDDAAPEVASEPPPTAAGPNPINRPVRAPAPAPATAPATVAALPVRDAGRAVDPSATPAAPIPPAAVRLPSPRQRAALDNPLPRNSDKRPPKKAPQETDGITDL